MELKHDKESTINSYSNAANVSSLPTKSTSETRLWSASAPLMNQDQHDLFMPGFITMPSTHIFSGCEAYISQQSIDIQFSRAYTMLGSSSINGGYSDKQRYVSLKVSKENAITEPRQVMADYLKECTLLHSTSSDELSLVGTITTAAMHSCCITSAEVIENDSTIRFFVIATSEKQSFLSVGDEAHYPNVSSRKSKPLSTSGKPSGITVFLAFDQSLLPSAQAEVLVLMAEAKVMALSSLKIKSSLSKQIATGTCTDVMTVACPAGASLGDQLRPPVSDVGKHTLLAERLGRIMVTAIKGSLKVALR